MSAAAESREANIGRSVWDPCEGMASQCPIQFYREQIAPFNTKVNQMKVTKYRCFAGCYKGKTGWA